MSGVHVRAVCVLGRVRQREGEETEGAAEERGEEQRKEEREEQRREDDIQFPERSKV